MRDGYRPVLESYSRRLVPHVRWRTIDVDMPDRLLDLLFRFLHQNGGRLSKRAREKEFSALTKDEIARIEALCADHQNS